MEKINSETIVGITLVTIALIFIFAATMNQVWAIILPADYLILALGFVICASLTLAPGLPRALVASRACAVSLL